MKPQDALAIIMVEEAEEVEVVIKDITTTTTIMDHFRRPNKASSGQTSPKAEHNLSQMLHHLRTLFISMEPEWL